MGKVFLRHFVLYCKPKTTLPFLIEISAKFASQINYLDSHTFFQWHMDRVLASASWGCSLLQIRGESLRETTLRGYKGVMCLWVLKTLRPGSVCTRIHAHVQQQRWHDKREIVLSS